MSHETFRGRTRLADRSGEVGPLGQEPVPGMDRLRTGHPRRVQHRLDREVRLCRRRRSESHCRVSLAYV